MRTIPSGIMACSNDEMIFQMLSRKEYSHDYIADFIGVTVRDVELVARRRHDGIKANFKDYVKYSKIVKDATAGAYRDDEDIIPACARVVHAFRGGYRQYYATKVMDT